MTILITTRLHREGIALMRNPAIIITPLMAGLLLAAVILLPSAVAAGDRYQEPSGSSEAPAVSASPNQSMRLTLKESLQIALGQNLDIHMAQESVADAEAQVDEARSAMLPHLGAEASYGRLDKELTASVGPVSMTIEEKDIYKAGLVIRQPIFAGGRLNAARRAGIYAWDAKQRRQEAVVEEIVYQVTRAYHTAQTAAEFRDVASEAVALLEKHEHDVAILVKEGATGRIDLLRTRTELANARKDLNTAENDFDLAVSILKNLLRIELETPVELSRELDRKQGPGRDLPFYTDYALAHRPELTALSFQVKAAEECLKAAKGEYLPNVGIEGRYEYIEGDMRELEGDDHWTLGIKAEVPLWNWGQTAARVRQAQHQLTQARIGLQKTRDDIRLQVRRSYLDLEKSLKNITAAEAALDAAEEAYRQSRVLYMAGYGINTDVLEARSALSLAKADHARARYNRAVALAALHRATGTVSQDLISRMQ